MNKWKDYNYLKPFFIEDDVIVYNPITLEKGIIKRENYLKSKKDKSSNIFITKKDAIDKISTIKPKDPNPKIMYMILTDACNFRCKYCFVEESFKEYPTNYMTKETADKALNLFLKCKNARKIIFYGGEPLLNREVMHYIVNQVKKSGKKIDLSMVTNGSLITDDDAIFIKENKISIGISVDGTEEIHNKMRIDRECNPTFDNVLRGWRTLEKHGVKPGASFTLGSHNVDNLEKTIIWVCENLKPTAIGFNVLNAICGKDNPAYAPVELTAEKLIKAYEIIKKYNIYEDRLYSRRIKPFINKKFFIKDCCGCGDELAISPEGMIGPCHGFVSSKKYFLDSIPTKESKIKENSIWREWNNRYPLNMEECENCAAIGICGGGCPYFSYAKHGDIWKLDERNCILCNTTLSWLIKESYSRIKNKKIDKIYRQPQHGDEKKFLDFLETIKTKKSEFDIEKLKDTRFIIGMINLIQQGKASCLFAEKNFKIVGFANVIKQDDKTAFVGIAVSKTESGNGTAKELLVDIEIEAKKIAIQTLKAEMAKENKESFKFFTKNGYKKTHDENDRIFLEKKLGPTN